MIGIIAALVIAIWFFRRARRLGRNGFGWAVLGVVSYYVPNLLWQSLVSMPIARNAMRSGEFSGGTFFACVLAGVGLGIACAIATGRSALPRKSLAAHGTSDPRAAA